MIAVSSTFVKRLPLTGTMIYLGFGAVLGPVGLGLLLIEPIPSAALLERITEIAVVISLFTTGLKLRVSWRDKVWWIPVRLAFVSMTFTVGLVTLVGFFGLGLPLGAAVLLGAVLAPTDPVLASEVQLESAADRDRLRFSITGEAGLNDGTAFPFVMLGLGLMGLHEIGEWGWRWFAIDVVWSIAGGIGIGAGVGVLVGTLVLHLRREHKEGFGLDEFLALGLMALVYGIALLAHTYGFLAVFAAGLALRLLERHHSRETPAEQIAELASAGKKEEIATHPKKAPAFMAEAVLGFNEQLERIVEVGVVLLVGAMLTPDLVDWTDLWFAAVLFLVIRPVAVVLGVPGKRVTLVQHGLICWFGIRGIASLYYIAFAITHGMPEEIAGRLVSITLIVIAVSVLVHGISVTPLMKWYRARNFT
ncbi:MAG TPA: cation:proton antiporter [Phycisphaerae bacterium]|nr:cation:proton antiporter [Phycisphaerae bacterium]